MTEKKKMKENEAEGTEGVQRCVMRYAQNRIDLAKVKKEIDALIFKEGEWRDIDLSGHRAEWLEQGYAWHSWTEAVEHAEEEPNEGEMELARLLDKKKSIKRECGDIKRRIYNLGRLMLKNA